jgi:replicative DNA helicase
VGGAPYIAQLLETQPFILKVGDHADIVTEAYRRRRAIEICQRGAAVGYEPVESTQAYLEGIETELGEVAHARATVKLELVGKVASREVTRLADAREAGIGTGGLPTGFADLDRMTGGLYPGDLTIVAARPGMGKSAFLTSLLMNITRLRAGAEPPAGAMFSLEMPRSQIAMRFAVHEALVSMQRVRTGSLARDEWQKLVTGSADMATVPLWIDDTANLGLLELRSMIRKLKREIESGATGIPSKKLGVVGVDYIQLMQGIARRGGTREEEVASLSRGLKALAKDEDIPIVALAQLNRNLEKNKDKRPGLADLRESGSIEQDADNVFFLYRESYYDKEANREETELIVGKQRNGPTGSVTLMFKEASMRFYSFVQESDYDWDHTNDDKYFDGGA